MTHFTKKWLIFLDPTLIFLYFILFTACTDQPVKQAELKDQFFDLYTEDDPTPSDRYLSKDQLILDLTMRDLESIALDQNSSFPSDLQITDQQNDLLTDNDAESPIIDFSSEMPIVDMSIAVPLYHISREDYLGALEAQDSDQDGLDDGWESLLGDLFHFNPNQSDSDADGLLDGLDDDDGDGLSNQQEQYLSTLPLASRTVIEITPPHPLAKDLLIEIDIMMGKSLSNTVYSQLLEIWQAHPFDQINGVRLHIYEDQSLVPVLFNGSFEQRNELLRQNPPTYFPSSFPSNQLIHVIVGTKRLDNDQRAGEAVTDGNEIEGAGLILYYDLLDELHPRCGIDTPPPVPFIVLDEALAGTFAHELGHMLQLGHDTEQNGLNPWNLMAVTQGCTSSRQRFHGEGNQNQSLGSVEQESSSRFSQQAFELMRFDLKLSVETGTMLNQGLGLEH